MAEDNGDIKDFKFLPPHGSLYVFFTVLSPHGSLYVFFTVLSRKNRYPVPMRSVGVGGKIGPGILFQSRYPLCRS